MGTIRLPRQFHLDQIFQCGQAFRFEPDGAGYAGIAFGRPVRFCQRGQLLDIDDDDKALWRSYFDLDRDYGEIQAHFKADPVMQNAIAYGSGIRILKQDLFEALITFILSQQNNIPRIKGLVSHLCMAYGEPLPGGYAFPTPERLAAASEEELRSLGCGFRAPYLMKTTRAVVTGEFPLSPLFSLPIAEARSLLMTLPGVGPKVADCVLLFGAARFDAFPVDVWMKRAIGTLYDSDSFDPSSFGPYCGVAQQYLFFYARSLKIGK